ncbi:MAG: efflux RND transporter permease subunit [Bdellovibrionota bacterium]
MKPAELYDLADQTLRPLIEQVKDVGVVQVVGGRKREIQVLMNQDQLTRRQISGTQIVNQLAIAGKNVPGGKLKVMAKNPPFEAWGSSKPSKTSKNAGEFLRQRRSCPSQRCGPSRRRLQEEKPACTSMVNLRSHFRYIVDLDPTRSQW